ncbi:MAG: hypothetical protein M3350_00625 [Actinomycetota bacterium]|nr:hypothetical protein [Actinomycetota bacterium]MDQ3719291.1 hypothetical protein [Actinomycetota bacterium]
MNGEPEAPTAAERGLDEHLELLRSDQRGPMRSLVRRTVRTARWQRVARAPLKVAGMIAAALIDGLGLVAQRRRGR